MIWQILIVVLLILLNGFFAMAELAVVSSRRGRLQEMAGTGDHRARTVLALLDDPTEFLSTVQIGITLVGVLAGAYSGATLAEPLGAALARISWLGGSAETVAIALVVIGITFLSLVVGELVPKRVALTNAERIAIAVARPLAWLSQAGRPVVWLLRVSTEAVLRLLRVGAVTTSPVTEEEVRSLIAEGARTGVFEKAETEMIEGVLRLADRPVRSIMIPRRDVIWLDPDDPVDVVRDEVASSGHSRFPVGRNDLEELIGVVQTKDLLVPMLRGDALDLAAHARQPLIVHEGMSVLKLLDMFRHTPVHMAIVADEYGSIEGVVTPMDILIAIAGDLPETADAAESDAVQRDDGSWLVDGRLAIDEVERLLGRRDLEGEGDYTTLAGFVLWQLGHIPQAAESFTWHGLRFEVVDMDGRRIDKVLIEPLDEAA